MQRLVIMATVHPLPDEEIIPDEKTQDANDLVPNEKIQDTDWRRRRDLELEEEELRSYALKILNTDEPIPDEKVQDAEEPTKEDDEECVIEDVDWECLEEQLQRYEKMYEENAPFFKESEAQRASEEAIEIQLIRKAQSTSDGDDELTVNVWGSESILMAKRRLWWQLQCRSSTGAEWGKWTFGGIEMENSALVADLDLASGATVTAHPVDYMNAEYKEHIRSRLRKSISVEENHEGSTKHLRFLARMMMLSAVLGLIGRMVSGIAHNQWGLKTVFVSLVVAGMSLIALLCVNEAEKEGCYVNPAFCRLLQNTTRCFAVGWVMCLGVATYGIVTIESNLDELCGLSGSCFVRDNLALAIILGILALAGSQWVMLHSALLGPW